MKKLLYVFGLFTSVCSAQCIPVPAVCYPVTLDTIINLGIGITFVSLNQIQNPSVGHSSTLQDFTCTDSTSLNMAQPYAFEVHTGLDYEETVTAWIDFNNDGAFNQQEIVFHDTGNGYMHTGFITIAAGTLNSFTPIRMRVGSDYTGLPSLNACDDILYGHYEDYKIFYGVNIGVDENELQFISSIYPNPLHASATIDCSRNKRFRNTSMQLHIYNSFGDLVSQKEIPVESEVTIDGTALSNGLYFYELSNSRAEKSTGKFVVE